MSGLRPAGPIIQRRLIGLRIWIILRLLVFLRRLIILLLLLIILLMARLGFGKSRVYRRFLVGWRRGPLLSLLRRC